MNEEEREVLHDTLFDLELKLKGLNDRITLLESQIARVVGVLENMMRMFEATRTHTNLLEKWLRFLQGQK